MVSNCVPRRVGTSTRFIMKQLIVILLIVASINARGQYTPQQREVLPEWAKTTILFTSSIALSAVGDALNDEGHKTWGHACNATSTGILLVAPFVLDIDRRNWYLYPLSYTFIRFGVFNPVYNSVRGLPLGYAGSSSITDRAINQFSVPDNWNVAMHSLSLVVGVSIPINDFWK